MGTEKPEPWPDEEDELGIIIDVIDEENDDNDDNDVPDPPDFDNWDKILRRWEKNTKELEHNNEPKPSWETDPEARRRYILEKEQERMRKLGFPLRFPCYI